jgi:transcriptional regulator with XRE-family HTH domain
MEQLKKLRLAYGKTQADMARELGTTQQTYARWEVGKSAPPLSALRDLALTFSTTVDHLLGREPRPATTRHHILANDGDGFWGHLGLLLPGAVKTSWYPITAGEATRLRRQLAKCEASEWIVTATLNNHFLAFRPAELKRIWLLDDDSDEPDDWDWEGPWNDGNGIPLELYRAMADWVDGELGGLGDFEEKNSPTMQETALSLIKEGSFLQRPDDLNAFLRHTVLHFTDGSTIKYEADQDAIKGLIVDIDDGEPPAIVSLSAKDGDFESFFPMSALRMIDVPMIEFEAGGGELGE